MTHFTSLSLSPSLSLPLSSSRTPQRWGRLDDQIELLKHKLDCIRQGVAFNGKRTKTARSQGKKFQVSIEQEATRLLVSGWKMREEREMQRAGEGCMVME